MKASKSYRNNRAATQFVDVTGKSMKDSFVENLGSANYSNLTNGSTELSMLEQELLYALYLSDGKPIVKVLSIETLEHTHADGLKESIETTFQNIGITPMYNYLANLYTDQASVNTGIHNRLGVKMKADAPWLIAIHCLNYNFKLLIRLKQ